MLIKEYDNKADVYYPTKEVNGFLNSWEIATLIIELNYFSACISVYKILSEISISCMTHFYFFSNSLFMVNFSPLNYNLFNLS